MEFYYITFQSLFIFDVFKDYITNLIFMFVIQWLFSYTSALSLYYLSKRIYSMSTKGYWQNHRGKSYMQLITRTVYKSTRVYVHEHTY